MSPRTIVVTGASSGLGRAIVEEFAARGWHVAAGVRRPADHPGLFAALPRVALLPLDVTDQAQVEALAAAVLARYGRVDALVNNAGALLAGPLETSTMAQIRAQYETNVFGLLMVTKAFLPQLRAQRSGVIVNIASASALVTFPFLGAYGSSKAAVAALSEALAAELAPFNVRVKVIVPGTFATRIFTRVANGLTPGPAAAAYRPYVRNFLAAQAGVARAGAPRELARLVYRAVVAGDGRTRYVIGRDAALLALLRRFLPQRAIARALAASIARPPSPLAQRALARLAGGTEPLEADWSEFLEGDQW
jgi:NAD(P)-dependent dehydrogenase (short-subunit alcohol dehydrogenase family)